MEMQRRLAVKKDSRLSVSPRSDSFRGGGAGGAESGELDHDQLNVIFQRDEARGYGLTVFGDNPVFVQSVTEKGPAAGAGLKRGDRIVRVNGKFVSRSNHVEVVDLIKAESCVAMTVVRTPPINGEFGQHVANPAYENNEEKMPRNVPKLSQPPTPPPIDRIPRHQDDSGLRGPRSSPANSTGLNRRRSNPEAMHLGVSRIMHLAVSPGSQSADQSALNRSTSTVSVGAGKLDRQNSIPDELPPALPVKRRMEQRYRNSSLHDVNDFATPSGTPPPPYGLEGQRGQRVPKSGSFNGLSVGPRVHPFHQLDIMTAEESSFHINQGPFSEYFALQRNLPHLAVFLNFLLASNIDDSIPLLFHLITDIYQKGNSKEMQRWAFEIHSTFIVPGSPLELLSCVSCQHGHTGIVSAVDEVLAKPDREELLRDIFTNARLIALEVIKMRLLDFHKKRNIGLGTFYGPTDVELEEAVNSPERTREIVDNLLGCHLEAITAGSTDDPENRSDRQAALGCALATFLKCNGIKAMGRDGAYLVDKWPLFVQKEKSKFKLKDKASKKSINVSGHQFAPVSFTTLSSCMHCQTILWGVGPQGYQCASCDFIAHRGCVRIVEELCVGEKKERRSFISMDSFGIFGRKRSNNSPTAIANAKKGHDEKEDSDLIGDVTTDQREESRPGGYVNQVVNRFETGKMQDGQPGDGAVAVAVEKNPKVPLTVVGRSESLKAQKKAQIRPGVRKKSDPAHFYRDDQDDAVEQNGNPLAVSAGSSLSPHSFPSDASQKFENDPDFEADPDRIPNWQTMLTDPSIVEGLDNLARKRQEVLAELFHTEQTHVGKLKMLHKVFYVPMRNDHLLSDDVIHQVFANLEKMIEIHVNLNEQMKAMKASGTLIGDVGDMLLSRFGGENGLVFKLAAAEFNRNQTRGLEALKNSQIKNSRLIKFLEEAMGNPLCRRLMLKDIIPTGMQRLTKYPLLLENLVKYTPSETEEEKAELKKVQAVLASSREILDFVNQAISDSANSNRLLELQEKIDMTSFVKSQHKMALEHKNIEFSNYCLLFDGDLTWRLTKQKTVDLHVILLNKMLLLVTKQDDRLLLKFHAPPVAVTDSKKPSENSKPWAPVLSLDGLAVRDVATDPRAFFVFQCSLPSSTLGSAQMYEMVANTVTEQKQWKRYILEAIDRVSHDYEAIKETFPATATASVTAPLSVVSAEADAHDSGLVESEDEDFTPGEIVSDGLHPLDRTLTLTSPSDVVVTEPFILNDAQIVKSHMEQIKRRDDQVEECLAEKQRLVSEILGISSLTQVPINQPESATQHSDGKVVIHRLMCQANSLTRLLNSSLTIRTLEDPEQVPLQRINSLVTDEVDRTISSANVGVQTTPLQQGPYVVLDDLQPVVSSLNKDLSVLMRYFCEKDEENERLRAELALVREELILVRTETRSSTPRPESRTSFLSLHSNESLHATCEESQCSSQLNPNIPVAADVVDVDGGGVEAAVESHNDSSNLQGEEIQHF